MLSEKEQAVFDYIRNYKERCDGVPPSRREIVDHCPVKSTSRVSEILKKLQALGLIRYEEKQARTIQVERGKWTYRKNAEDDYQEFLAWYEDNETWLEGCHTERQAFYAAWQAGAGDWYE